MKVSLACLFSITLVQWLGGSASARDGHEDVPFSTDAWQISAEEHRIESYRGHESLWLRNGEAILVDAGFESGVIEFDVLTMGERGFSGVVWRQVDGENYEHFYIRPHLSGKSDATQYQPVFHGVGGWQIYAGPAYGAAARFRVDEWMHVRLEILGDRARVFVDSDEPVLVIDDLKRESAAGAIGVSSGFAPARFANFRFERTQDLEIGPAPHVEPRLSGDGLIHRWAISEAFSEAEVSDRYELDSAQVTALRWHSLDVETNGVANMARIQSAARTNTALARIVLEADAAKRQRLDFGFSDRVRLFHNGDLVFAADDTYVSRDYRFLGTVGLHDSVFLELTKGRNVIDLAVTEGFGGWAVAGRLIPRDGVRRVVQ